MREILEELGHHLFVKIEFARARKILEEEVEEARSLQMKGPWVDRIRALGTACASGNRTMIAMLGTALLAKATDIGVDPFSLKVGDKKNSSNTYSARSLCEKVLAAEAGRLGIDLGVTGREPLNNHPFYKQPRVSRGMNVHSTAAEAFEILFDALATLSKVRTEKEARIALRSFLFVRVRKKSVVELAIGDGDNLTERDLLDLIAKFVSADSEGGKRAQAVAAGLLDAMQGKDKIQAKTRVNASSRGVPGDIGIMETPKSAQVDRVFEVRDKAISEKDLDILREDARKASITKVGMLAVSKSQPKIDTQGAINRAEARGVRLGVYFGWDDFVREALFWSKLPQLSVGPAYRAISVRLAEFEVSEPGQKAWQAAGQS